jgi:hypothetical protein
MPNLMLTLISVECVYSGSTAETVRQDAYHLGATIPICCEPRPLEATGYSCGAPAESAYRCDGRIFCRRACAADFAGCEGPEA